MNKNGPGTLPFGEASPQEHYRWAMLLPSTPTSASSGAPHCIPTACILTLSPAAILPPDLLRPTLEVHL